MISVKDEYVSDIFGLDTHRTWRWYPDHSAHDQPILNCHGKYLYFSKIGNQNTM